MKPNDVKSALDWEAPSNANVFACLDTVSKYMMEYGASSKIALDAIIRLRAFVEEKVISHPVIIDAIGSTF